MLARVERVMAARSLSADFTSTMCTWSPEQVKRG
jgi:hypothetical protein